MQSFWGSKPRSRSICPSLSFAHVPRFEVPFYFLIIGRVQNLICPENAVVFDRRDSSKRVLLSQRRLLRLLRHSLYIWGGGELKGLYSVPRWDGPPPFSAH